jgi:hypothetical protein
VLILSAAGVLVVLIVIGFLIFGNNEGNNKGKIPNKSEKASSAPRPEGFTFFDIGPDSTYTFEMREKLDDRLGAGVLETRGLIDLTISYREFFRTRFPELYGIHAQLNDETGARVEHDIIKLTYRYAQRKNTPFFYVELIFSNNSKNPLFFRIKSKKEGADIVDTLKEKYGKSMKLDPPGGVNPSGDDDTLLVWKKNKDYLVIWITKDRFGDPEFHIMIYYVENIDKLIAMEKEERKRLEEAKKKAGQTAF